MTAANQKFAPFFKKAIADMSIQELEKAYQHGSRHGIEDICDITLAEMDRRQAQK